MSCHVCIVSFNGYALWKQSSQAKIGGSEVQLFLLARELVKQPGQQLSYIVGDFEQPSQERLGSITIHRSIQLRKTLTSLIRAPFILWQVLGEVDADVYLSSPAGPEVGVIALWCRLHGRKYIYRTASSVDCTYEKARSLGPVGGLLYVLGVLLAHRVITQTTADQQQLYRHFRRRAIVIRNGVPITPRRAAPRSSDLLWVGSARAVKQPELFLDVARRFSQQSCVMVLSSAGEKKLYDQIVTTASQLLNLTVYTDVPFADVQRYFDQARIYVGTSAYEGFPNVYLQACLAATPVASLTVNPDGIITDHNIGTWAKGSIQQLYDDVDRLLYDPREYQAKASAARRYVEQFHASTKIARRWQDLIDNLCA